VTRSARGRATAASVLAIAFVGCNEILDNKPGTLAENDRSSVDAEPSPPRAEGEAPAAPDPQPASKGEQPVDSGDSPSPTGEEEQADHDANAAGGCEAEALLACGAECVDPTTSIAHCGACDVACPPVANGTGACTLGVCGFTCSPGFGDCDVTPANGCEAAFAKDPLHCGACNSPCFPGEDCVNGACVLAGVGPRDG
jgi:hypothetical protein